MSETLVAVNNESQALARGTDLGGAGTLAMAMMSEQEFQTRLAALKQGQKRMQAIKRELMEDGTHYGVIPGTKKPTLLKPGAEVLCSIYGLRPDFVPEVGYGDGVSAPHVSVRMRCELHLGDIAGPVVAVGYGAANSWERKHRYRAGERACPACGVVGSIRRSSFERDGDKGWYCHQKAGGCNATWRSDDAAIVGQVAGMIENPDPYDLENTLVKMAKKRAHIDAALTGTASSDLFTQDLDEEHQPETRREREPEAGDTERQAPARPTEVRSPAPAAPQRSSNGNGGVPNCPGCAKRGMVSKRPVPGKPYYCLGCKLPYGTGSEQVDTPAAAPASNGPADDPFGGDL